MEPALFIVHQYTSLLPFRTTKLGFFGLSGCEGRASTLTNDGGNTGGVHGWELKKLMQTKRIKSENVLHDSALTFELSFLFY